MYIFQSDKTVLYSQYFFENFNVTCSFMTAILELIKTNNSILYKDLVLNKIYQYGYAIIYYGFSLSCSLIKVYFIQT